jgi:hypothetical protein
MTKNKKIAILGVLGIIAYFALLFVVIALEEGYIQIGGSDFRLVAPASASETTIDRVKICSWDQIKQEANCD